MLHGGVANAGAVVRVGGHVLRPAPANVDAVHALLRWLRDRGFDGVPDPVGIDPDGRERLVFIPGDVAIPPFPAWSQTDDALASIARLLRRYHDAVAGFPLDGDWNRDMADPDGGALLCHNDVCLENVVFRDGAAVALLDFEFAAPGRPLFDLAALAHMCTPVHPGKPRVGERLRVAADAYGLDAEGRMGLLEQIAGRVARGGEFVARRVARGEQGFIDMWEANGGMAHFDRRRAWFAEARADLEAALL